MKILAWNIQQGGGSRAVEIGDSIISSDCDVVILSEFRNNKSGHYLRSKLLTKEYIYQYGSVQDAYTNGVLIASKIPCDFQGFSNVINDFPQAIVKAVFTDFFLWGLYLPHKKKHTLFPFLVRQIEQAGSHILMGDFNTGINFLDQKGDSFWYTEYLTKLAKIGLVDAFRTSHGQVREYSWVSHQGNGYRYDHCWMHQDLLPKLLDCSFDHKVREGQLSDHSAMILTLDWLDRTGR